MKQFPQDSGSGLSSQTDRDYGDAAHFGALANPAIEGLVSGCGFTVDYTTPNVTVASGQVRIIATNLDSRDHGPSGITTWPESIQVYKVSSTTVGLTDGTTNEVFVQGDQANPDDATVVTTSDGTTPADPYLKIGEVDTSGDTKSEQWYLLSDSGMLTFPTQSAAESEPLSEGTAIYDRANNAMFVEDGT